MGLFTIRLYIKSTGFLFLDNTGYLIGEVEVQLPVLFISRQGTLHEPVAALII